MADTCGYQDTGSKSHMVNGCPDIGRNDRGVGFGLRDTGVDKNDGNPIAPAGCYPRPGRPPSRLGVFVIQQGGRRPRSRIIATAFLSGGVIFYILSEVLNFGEENLVVSKLGPLQSYISGKRPFG